MGRTDSCVWLLLLLLSAIFLSTPVASQNLLYPYGPAAGDEALENGDDVSSPLVRLSSAFPFLGTSQEAVYVNSNGLLSFGSPLPSYLAATIPLSDSPTALIAPYWSNVDTSGIGGIYYRETNDSAVLEMARDQIESAFRNLPGFQPSSLFIATWDAVGYFDTNIELLNTFQCVLATDGNTSFVIFLYEDLQWARAEDVQVACPDSSSTSGIGASSSTSSSASSGSGASSDTSSSASGGSGASSATSSGSNSASGGIANRMCTSNALPQSGITAGNGTGTYTLPGSGTENVLNISSSSNVGIPGLWLFQVDGEDVLNGDPDECALSLDDCDENANCTDVYSGFSCTCNSGYSGNGTFCEDINECDDDPCDMNAECSNIGGSFICTCDAGYSGDGFNCTCPDGGVRLLNYSVPMTSQGRVEVCINNTFGSVCDDFWDEVDARVVCRRAGMETDDALPVRGAFFGPGNGSIFLDNVVCQGNEFSLLECEHNPIGEHNCDHSEDAGVICGATCVDGSVRLLVGEGTQYYLNEDDYENYYLIKDQLSRGRVEVCMGGEFATVCDDSWNNQAASVVCRQLGFSTYGAIAVTSEVFFEPSLLHGLRNVLCVGDESALLDCIHSTIIDGSCRAREDAGVVCQEPSVPFANCTDGHLRLVGGANTSEGIVEICQNNAWGTVCNNQFSEDEATVICRQLGLLVDEDQIEALAGSQFTSEASPIFLDQLSCFGDENTLLDCPKGTGLGLHSCDHSQDAAVRCSDFCSVNNGGCEQLCVAVDGVFGCQCYPGHELNEDGKTCRALSACSEEGAVRLVNGSTGLEGRVEVCVGGMYGTVCDDHWDVLDARVVCRQLNFTGNDVVPLKGGYFGIGTSQQPIHLDNVDCQGTESSLLDCEHNSTGVNNCDHSEDAGVICGASCIEGTVRLLVGVNYDYYEGLTDYDSAFYIKDELSRGRVEVCVGGQFATVCDESWNNQAASVVCRQLGFSAYGAVAITSDLFSDPEVSPLVRNVVCSGDETGLLDCDYTTDSQSSCSATDDAGVVCQDASTEFGNCTHGEVRLLGSDDATADTREGRVEICINNAWGTICDDLWGPEDAEVFCRQLEGFTSEGAEDLFRAQVGEGTGPIFLQQLVCSGSESSLLSCTVFIPLGQTTCGHNQDAGARCRDIDECTDGNAGCAHNCTNTIGSFECSCSDGFELADDRLNCSDIDECGRGVDNCDGNATCTNTVGSFTCTCITGFSGDGTICMDINECDLGRDDCSDDAECMNTIGGYTCSCRGGYSGNGFNCTDINECDDDPCGTNAECNNTNGSFICTCNIGYTGDGFSCEDTNECDDDPCDMNAQCNNTNGSFFCTCNIGYSGDGFNCTNIDECALESDNCDVNADCDDTDGSFTCTCHFGYSGDGVTCTCLDGGVRLLNYSVPMTSQGRVEVCINNTFGSVCDDFWDEVDARVVCGRAGMETEDALPIRGAFFGSANSSIFLDNVVCQGTESSLLDCEHNPIGEHNCDHSEDAGVICGATCVDGSVRLLVGEGTQYYLNEDDYENYYFIKDQLSRGRVEMCIGGQFATVCDDSWNNQAASVVCRQLGFSTYGAIAVTSEVFSESSLPHGLSEVQCVGDESVLLDCSHSTSIDSSCRAREDAGVVCQESTVSFANCTDGQLRLVGGANASEGIVEICQNNAWGTVCNSQFSDDEATVVCRQLGLLLDEDRVEVLAGSQFTSEASPIFLDQLFCSGDESTLLKCPRHAGLGLHSCVHSQDAAVRCPDPCSVNNGGCEQLCVAVAGGFGCQCYPGHELNVDGETCRVSGACSEEGAVRLVNGSTGLEGRVEVCVGGMYGTVCDDHWDVLDARVVCRQLNFTGNDVVPLKDGYFGMGTSQPIHLDNVDCQGTESSLLNCEHNTIGVHNCVHSEDAGVICGASCIEGTVRLLVGVNYDYYEGLTDYDGAFYIKDELSRGRVEVCVGGEFVTVCEDSWNNQAASVVCRQLGLSAYGAIAITSGSYSDPEVSPLVRNVECSGEESGLLDCNYTTDSQSSCSATEDAGVVCQDPSTEFGNCTHGEVRLVGSDNSTAGTREGRVEICINNAWGTICDDLWGTEDAEVFCHQLVGFTSQGAEDLFGAQAGAGVGPIFLQQLVCSGTEPSLLSCTAFIPLGQTTCGHNQDAGARCRDIDECADGSAGCAHNCTNTIGSFECSCREGFELADDRMNCDDIDECTGGTHNCDGRANCTNTEGSFTCTCVAGYTGDGTNGSCININECEEDMDNCHDNATCTDTEGSFTCMCNPGFTGDGVECRDIDECAREIDNCDGNAICTNTVGSFTCTCVAGFSGDGTTCMDINECEEDPYPCHQNADCMNTTGSFECMCSVGYSGDGFNCTDIDECMLGIDNCHGNATCSNTDGSFNCTCNTGFEGNGVNCSDINECAEDPYPCHQNADCMNTTGSFECMCNAGYSGDGFNCTDIDECEVGTHNCDVNANCSNNPGSFVCTCHRGYTGDGVNCSCANGDVLLQNGMNEMEGRVEICYNNTYGTVCDDRWDILDARVVCRQLNFTGNNVVSIHGAFFGSGSGPIHLDDVVCQGTESSLLDCEHNTIGVHNCDHSEDAGIRCNTSCIEGNVRLMIGDEYDYYLENLDQDYGYLYIKDELSRGRVEYCMNGSYGTICDVQWNSQSASVVCGELGFSRYGAIAVGGGTFHEPELPVVLSNVECSDLDQRLRDCQRTIGAGNQDCEDAGVICQASSTLPGECIHGDVRLVNGSNPLEGRVEICINNAWGTICDNEFSSQDAEVVCRQLDMLPEVEIRAAGETPEARREAAFGPGSGPIFLDRLNCESSESSVLECDRFSRLGLYSCTHSQDAGVKCPDEDECRPNPCHANANCINQPGSFECVCKVGYEGDGVDRCDDINECNNNNGGCADVCINTDGSFLCECTNMFGPGYRANGLLCIDINECDENLDNCHENADCINIIGSFTCSCSIGYTGDGVGDCRDIDECEVNDGGCSQNCTNTIGSFICVCMVGYELDEDNLTCNDVNECERETHNCDPNAMCINTNGSFDCLCNSGYTGDGVNGTCTNIDECRLELDDCDDNANCTDTEGSYNCTCDIGFTGDGFECFCTNGSVRLMDGSTQMEGRVEVCYNNNYGTVCDDLWDTLDARVVCSVAGMPTEDALPVRGAYFGSGNGPILLDNVICQGTESSLLGCVHNTIGEHNCDHSEDAGVICGALCRDGSVRLQVGEDYAFYEGPTDNDNAYFLKDELNRGRVEICVNGTWGAVCEILWDHSDASVVCRQLGFSPYGAVAGGETFSDENRDILLSDVECNGTEKNLLECMYNASSGQCGPFQDAHVACQDISIETTPNIIDPGCADGQLRLVDGPNVREGRLEICINRAWGTVCQNQFGTTNDAVVVCRQMGFSERDARILLLNVQRGTGPIFLEDVRCERNHEGSFLECPTSNPLGLTTCSHFRDVGVHCEAFCPHTMTSVTRGDYSWEETPAEEAVTLPCVYGGVVGAENPMATRQCDDRGLWEDPDLENCLTFVTSSLADISNIILTSENLDTVTEDLDRVIQQANAAEDQSSKNLAVIAQVFDMIAENEEVVLDENAASSIVRVLDAIQSWQKDVLQNQSAEIVNMFENMVVEFVQLEDFPLTPVTVEAENMTFIGERVSREEIINAGGRKFSVLRNNATGHLEARTTRPNEPTDGAVSIMLPAEVFERVSSDVGLVFTMFQSSVLFPQANETVPTFAVASTVVGAIVPGYEVMDLTTPIEIVLHLEDSSYETLSCRHWDPTAAEGIGDWVEGGCDPPVQFREIITCECYHLTNFAVHVNTDPFCPMGFKRNIARTRCMPIPPDIQVNVPTEVPRSTYIQNSNTYMIDSGREFGLQCTSTGNHSGNVTWYRKGPGEELVPVSEIEVLVIGPGNGDGSGSGDEEDIMFETTYELSGFPVQGEQVGQLYAYRYSDSEAVLRTRTSNGTGGQQVRIGIEEVADGMYMCIAENTFTNESTEVDIKVMAPTVSGGNEYLRFSAEPVEQTQQILQLNSADFVTKAFESVILSALEPILNQGVKCETVERRNESYPTEIVDCDRINDPFQPREALDVLANQTRYECNISFSNNMMADIPTMLNMQLPGVINESQYNTSDVGFCDYECTNTTHGFFCWPETEVSMNSTLLCEYGPEGSKATRRCSRARNWEVYYGGSCTTRVTRQFQCLSETEVTPEIVGEVVGALDELISEADESDQTSENLEVVADVLDDTTSLIDSGNFSVDEGFMNNTVGIMAGISDWPEDVLEEQSSEIVEDFEAIAENLVSQDNFTSLVVIEEEITLVGQRTPAEDLQQTGTFFIPPLPENISIANFSNASIEIPPIAFNGTEGNTGVFFTRYSTPILFPLALPNGTLDNETSDIIDSIVIAATVAGMEVSNLEEPVIITLTSNRIRDDLNWSNPRCVSWLFNALPGGRGNWTDEGCEVASVNADTGIINCECDHLTNFAILVDINAREDAPRFDVALKALSIAGATISMVGCAITVFTMVAFRKIRKRDASKFHAQLCIAIFLMLLFFLVGIDRTETEVGCTIFSLLIHYFTFASLFWMAAEAVLMFQKLIIVFGRITIKYIVTVSLVCWLLPIPFLVIGLTTLATGENHLISRGEEAEERGHQGYCFIDHTGVLFGIFLGPIFAVLIFNFVVFVLVIRVLVKHSRRKIVTQEKDSQKYKATLKTLISIVGVMLMFGLTWLFGAFTIFEASLAFQFLFIFFNSLQGFFLFVFFCVIGKDAREEWMNLIALRKWRNLNKTLSTPSKSSSNGNKKTGSTYITSRGGKHGKVILHTTGYVDSEDTLPKSGVELTSIGPSMSIVDKVPMSITEEDETAIVVANGLVSTQKGSQSKLVPDDEPDYQVPPYVIARLEGHHRHLEDSLDDTEAKFTQLAQIDIMTDLDLEPSFPTAESGTDTEDEGAEESN